MKTFILKEPVNHKDFGNGKIESVREGGAMYKVDFNGTLRTCRASELERVKENKFTPMPTVTGVLAEVQKLQEIYKTEVKYLDLRTSLTDVQLATKTNLKRVINDLENILQGKK